MPRVFDVVQAPNQALNEIVYRVPESGAGDFRIGSQVIVRENQVAVFYRDGKALDTFGPGRHTITTGMPMRSSPVRLATRVSPISAKNGRTRATSWSAASRPALPATVSAR